MNWAGNAAATRHLIASVEALDDAVSMLASVTPISEAPSRRRSIGGTTR